MDVQNAQAIGIFACMIMLLYHWMILGTCNKNNSLRALIAEILIPSSVIIITYLLDGLNEKAMLASAGIGELFCFVIAGALSLLTSLLNDDKKKSISTGDILIILVICIVAFFVFYRLFRTLADAITNGSPLSTIGFGIAILISVGFMHRQIKKIKMTRQLAIQAVVHSIITILIYFVLFPICLMQ